MRLFFLFLIFSNAVPGGWAQPEDSAASVAENRTEALASLLVAVKSLEGEVDTIRSVLNDSRKPTSLDYYQWNNRNHTKCQYDGED